MVITSAKELQLFKLQPEVEDAGAEYREGAAASTSFLAGGFKEDSGVQTPLCRKLLSSEGDISSPWSAMVTPGANLESIEHAKESYDVFWTLQLIPTMNQAPTIRLLENRRVPLHDILIKGLPVVRNFLAMHTLK
jgi:hypothetical protein